MGGKLATISDDEANPTKRLGFSIQDLAEKEAAPATNADGAPLSKAELRRRNRSIRASKALFRTIDVVFRISQNVCPYVNKRNVETIETVTDVVYDESLPSVCMFDMYRVKTDEPQPAVILVHGGGFSAGDKKYRKGMSQFFALNGFTVFTVNYGLSPQFIFPDPLKHLVTAANYIYDNSQRFNIDTSRIFVSGDSAGGYYSAMLAAFNCTDIFREKFNIDLKFKVYGTLLNCGIYDLGLILNTKFILDLDDGVFLSFIGMSREDIHKYEYLDCCMPIDYINKDFPPTFATYSDHDIFCKGQGNVLIDKLNALGVYNEFYSARHTSSNHCFSLSWEGDDPVAANELMMSFAKRLAADKIKI